MIKVSIARDTCRGYGNCVLVAGKIFDVDADGLVILLEPTVPEERLAEVQGAIYDCPTNSIAFEIVDDDAA